MDAPVDSLPGMQGRTLWPQLISPRPIALVTTVSKEGVRNIAPYNSYSGLSTSPPMLGLSVSSRKGGEKRTLRNAEETGAFVVNLTPRFMADVMIAAAIDTEDDVDDFARLDVTPAASARVAVERIRECPAALECRVSRIMDLAPSRCRLIVAEIVAVSIRDEFYDPMAGFDALGADLLASVGVDQYVTVNGEALTLPVTWE